MKALFNYLTVLFLSFNCLAQTDSITKTLNTFNINDSIKSMKTDLFNLRKNVLKQKFHNYTFDDLLIKKIMNQYDSSNFIFSWIVRYFK